MQRMQMLTLQLKHFVSWDMYQHHHSFSSIFKRYLFRGKPRENQRHLRRVTGTGDDGGSGDGGGQEGGVVGIEGVFVGCGVIVHYIPLPPIQKVAAVGDPCCPPSPSQLPS